MTQPTAVLTTIEIQTVSEQGFPEEGTSIEDVIAYINSASGAGAILRWQNHQVTRSLAEEMIRRFGRVPDHVLGLVDGSDPRYAVGASSDDGFVTLYDTFDETKLGEFPIEQATLLCNHLNKEI